MGYEYKEIIMQNLGIHDDEEKTELDEVYRKAQAFDRIEDYLADQQGYDWDDEYTLTLIAGEVEKVVMEEE